MGDHPGILFTLPHSSIARTGKGLPGKEPSAPKYAVEALLVDEGLLDAGVLVHFSYAMDLREGADYGYL